MGLLGKTIGDSHFEFEVEVRLGAGAFVCGEETALIASVEGKRGVPRPRPPVPAYSGFNHCPTLLNNVETFANIAPILHNGGDWFASIGTGKSKGTKVFALVGDVNNTGLIEVPMGIKLRDLVYKLGGGIPGDRKFKAVQTGGPSGGCIPEQFLDMDVDYESLASVGSIMGSGGMIVMRPRAWSMWPSSLWTLRATNPAANAFPAAWAQLSCTACLSASAKATDAWKIWTRSNGWA
jgi:bidirectional [NiFe] hydrogenase diaphorase subunit